MPRRNVDGVHAAKQGRERDDLPDFDFAGQGKPREHEGQYHGRRLGSDHHPMAIPAVGDDASHGAQKKNRELRAEADQAEQKRGACKLVDEPGLGNVLHPGADQRNKLSAHEELKIAVRERTEPHRQAGALWHDRDLQLRRKWYFFYCIGFTHKFKRFDCLLLFIVVSPGPRRAGQMEAGQSPWNLC